MNERATTWEDLLNRRAGQRFIGRHRELDRFRLNYLYTIPQALLFVLQGPPGIGKSALIAQYRTIAREHGVMSALVTRWDVQVGQQFAVLQAMSTLADQLAAAGMPLTTFREVYRDYWEGLQTLERDAEAPGRPWDLLGGVMDEDEWASRAWDAYLTSVFPLRRAALMRRFVETLTERFVQDLNAWAVVRRIVLCLDDWQALARASGSPYIENWLLELLTGGQLSTNIWVVLATRTPLSPRWDPLATITASFDLQALKNRESRALLRRYDMVDAAAAAARVALSRGNPLQLVLLALGAEDLSSTGGESSPLVNYIDGLDPVLRAAVLRSAAARWLDEDVLAVLLGEDAIEHMDIWLGRTPLIEQVGSAWRFRPDLTPQIREIARLELGSTWSAAQRTLYAYHRQRLELHGSKPRYLDPAWRRDAQEALYYALLIGEEDAALNLALEHFARGIREFYPWAGVVADIWGDAAQVDAGRMAVRGWAEVVQRGWQALVNREWEAALASVEDLLRGELWDAEVRKLLRSLHHLVAARLALPLEPEPHAFPLEPEDEKVLKEVSPVEMETVCDLPPEAVTLSSAETDRTAQASAETASQRAAGAPEAGDPTGVASPAPQPSDADAAVQYCTDANARLDAGDYDAAIQAYDRALSLNPKYVAAYYNRGLAYAALGALDSAIADCTRAIELAPDQVQAYRQRGLLYFRKGVFDQALRDYDAALQLDPGMVEIHYDCGNAHLRLGDYERAIADYTEALDKAPARAELHLNRGIAYAEQGNYPEALRDYNRAIALDPERAVTYNHRGQAYARLGHYTEALADYEQALELRPRYALAHNNRGLLYVRIEAYPEALEAYQRAMALEPDWATPYYNAACAAALIEDVEPACTWLARAVALREGYRAMAVRDSDFALIRDHPRFQALVRAATSFKE